MKKLRFIIPILAAIVLFYYVAADKVWAAPPFPTFEQVNEMITEALEPIEEMVDDLTGRTDELEEKVTSLEERVAELEKASHQHHKKQ